MMTREQIERVAAGCGVIVSYVESGSGGFVVDTTNVVYKSLTDIVMKYFDTSKGNGTKYFIIDENMYLAA